jgi:hypothetical protein
MSVQRFAFATLIAAFSFAGCNTTQNTNSEAKDWTTEPAVGLPVENPSLDLCSGHLRGHSSTTTGDYKFELKESDRGKYGLIELQNRRVGTYTRSMNCGVNRANRYETVCKEVSRDQQKYVVTYSSSRASVMIVDRWNRIVESLGTLRCNVSPAVGLPVDNSGGAVGLPVGGGGVEPPVGLPVNNGGGSSGPVGLPVSNGGNGGPPPGAVGMPVNNGGNSGPPPGAQGLPIGY